jgi:alpha-tubulin suppressor-like RCC1 family protein
LALIEDGTVMAWGESFYGQLANRTTENSDVPVPISDPTEVATISD